MPVGTPVEGATGLTVAVKVTDWPGRAGLRDDTTVVELDALFTVWVIAADVLELKLASPA
jgi:hypothetical protein